ncbi:MAG: PorP/SprF family type IX secretion system membrane protein [Saprospiraceae bacterium]
MQVKSLLSFLFAFLSCLALQAQDVHFTQFNMSPLTVNPAQAGKFEGTARVGGIYRNQLASIIRDEYGTPGAYVDAPILPGFRKRDWIGVGVGFFTDRAGTSQLKRSSFGLGGTYHLALDKKGKTVISIGGQYGNESRGLNRDSLTLEDHLRDNRDVSLSQDYGKINQGDVSFKDVNAGIMLSAQLNKNMDIQIGYAMYHIGRPNYGLSSSLSSKMPRRAVVHGQMNAVLNDRFTLSPTFLFQTMSGADEIIVQAMGGYLFNPERSIYLDFGLSYRLADALNLSPIVGMRVKDLKVGFAYDINTGSLSNTSVRGGFEIAASYIFKIYKPSVVKPKVLCPRF